MTAMYQAEVMRKLEMEGYKRIATSTPNLIGFQLNKKELTVWQKFVQGGLHLAQMYAR